MFTALVISGAVAATVAVSQAPARGVAYDTLIARLEQDWPSLDAYVDAGRATSWAVDGPLYDRLASLGPDGKGYVPYLATSWTQKAKTMTFEIRRGAKCTDGHELTALDVLNSVKRFIFVAKRSGSTAANGGGGFGNGPFHLHADNKKDTFTINTEKPFRNFVGSFANFPIICPEGLKALQTNPRALEGAAFGSGPYTLVEAVHGDHITFKLRPEWNWGPKGTSTKTMPTNLIYKVVADDTTAANLFLSGGLNLGLVEGPDVNRLLTAPLEHKIAPNYKPLIMVFNMKAGRLFADPSGAKIREAISTAVDPQKFNQAMYAGRGSPVTSVFRSDAECYDPKTKSLYPTPNMDKAKQILASDGWTLVNGKLTKNGQPMPRFRLLLTPLMNQGPDYVFSVLQDLGMDVEFVNLPGNAYGQGVLGSNFDLSIFRGTTILADPGIALTSFQGAPPPDGGNYGFTGYQDPDAQRFMNAGLQNLGKGGCKYFALYQELVLKKHYLFPLVAPNFDLFASQGIQFPKGSVASSAYPVYYLKVK
jgi:peptide/nickel transport system substrate-binding protein